MAAKPVTVDYKNNTVDFQMVFDQEIAPGHTSAPIKFDSAEFLDHVGVLTADHFNPTNLKVKTGPIKGNVGVSVFHDTPGDWIRTANRVPIKGKNLDSAYHHTNIPEATHETSIRIRPTKDQLKGRVAANNRKAIPLWADMTSANIRAGVTETKLGGKSRWIITRGEVVDGKVVTKGAMHAYISRNSRNPEFLDGEYVEGKAHMTTTENGERGYVVKNPEHIKLMDRMIGDMVETHSPFASGFGAVLTNNGAKPITEPVTVHFTFERQPMTKDGVQPIEDDVVTEHHVRRVVNGGAAADDELVSAETGAVIVLPGWEDELERAADPETLAAEYEVSPYVGEKESL